MKTFKGATLLAIPVLFVLAFISTIILVVIDTASL